MTFQLPELPFAKDALAPVMSAETLEYHWGKHHRAYVTKTNELVDADEGLSGASLIQLVKRAKEAGNNKLFNNSAQLWNHSFFWQCLAPSQGQQPDGKLAKLIEDGFGNAETLLQKLQEEAVNHFSNGWAWLVLDRGSLRVTSLHDADTPIVHDGMVPLVHARCVGARLLHRLSQRAPALCVERARQHRQLGLRRPEPRRQRVRARQSAGRPNAGAYCLRR